MGINRGYTEETSVQTLPRVVMEREYEGTGDEFRFELRSGTVVLHKNGERVGATSFSEFARMFEEEFGDNDPPLPSERIEQANPVTKPTTGRYNHYAHFESDEAAHEAVEVIEECPGAELVRDEVSVQPDKETYLAWSE